MTEQAFITLLNCAVRDLNKNRNHLRCYVRQEWRAFGLPLIPSVEMVLNTALCLHRLSGDGRCER
jgi:hypothetical protein